MTPITPDDKTAAGKPRPQYMDNPKACGAPIGWKWGYLPCGCCNDGYGNHLR